jgi:hypothetical protein
LRGSYFTNASIFQGLDKLLKHENVLISSNEPVGKVPYKLDFSSASEPPFYSPSDLREGEEGPRADPDVVTNSLTIIRRTVSS